MSKSLPLPISSSLGFNSDRCIKLIYKAFQNEERWCFLFHNILTHFGDIRVSVLHKLEIDDVISGYCVKRNHKMKNIIGKNGLR